MSKPTHLNPSKLGTRAYWDNLYTSELSNNTSNPSDKGTVWFDDSDAESKILSFLDSISTSPEDDSDIPENISPIPKENTSFLDLGCGNGSLLLALREESWSGRMLGIDYSPQSISLAKQVAAQAELEDPPQFKTWDILNGPVEDVGTEWDVILDKGTFDAISLSEEKDARGRRLNEGYCERALQVLKKGGLFLITSCNWTEEELTSWFVDGEKGFQVAGRVNYPSFSFGGVKGQTISTLCFKKT